MNRMFLVFLICVSPGLFAQDAYTGASSSMTIYEPMDSFRRNLLVYLYGKSGNLNNEAGPVFAGNDSELGIRYSQNFETVPWLSVSAQADLSVSSSWNYNPDNSPVPNSGSVGISNIMPVLRFGLRLTPYVLVEMHSSGILRGNVFWTNRWRSHYLTLIFGADLNYLNFINSEYTFAAAYEYLVRGWTLHSSFGFRFNSDLLSSFYFRLDLLAAYTVSGMTFWGRLRYEPRQALTAVRHEFSLTAGFNYHFQFIPGNPRPAQGRSFRNNLL